jgi:hypothetical protein
MQAEVCRHCGERIMKFHFRNKTDQWWHANPLGGAPTYRRCHADPNAPFAEP